MIGQVGGLRSQGKYIRNACTHMLWAIVKKHRT